MNQDELRETLLAALLDYETFKKTRRLKALKKALRGTIMATVIGSAGFTAANEGRNNQVRETAVTMASKLNAMSAKANPLQETSQSKFISGAAFFAFDRHTLKPADEEELIKLSKQLPKDAELTIIGCTDSLGVQHYNKKLATQRAQAVASYLASHGIKIKAIESRISKNKHASWLQRRVDIIVDSALTPLASNLPPLVKQRTPQQSETQPESQASLHTLDHHDKVTKVLQETEKRAVAGNSKSTKAKSEQPEIKHQNIRGVTHFAFNRHTLSSAHRERLMELIKQFPKEVELTVIGRTDADEYNKNLGMQRAKTVAIFLANNGLKVKAVGSKVSSKRHTGWSARRVDIVVDSALAPMTIYLPPLITHKHIYRTEAQPESQSRLISTIDGKGKMAIGNDITHLIEDDITRLKEQNWHRSNAN